MRHWWRSLGRSEQVTAIGVAATLLVGLVGALLAYLVFSQADSRGSSRSLGITTSSAHSSPPLTRETTSATTVAPSSSPISRTSTTLHGKRTLELTACFDLDAWKTYELDNCDREVDIRYASRNGFVTPYGDSVLKLLRRNAPAQYDSCERSTRIMDMVTEDELARGLPICVRTNFDRWVLLRPLKVSNESIDPVIEFEVTVWSS
jgi:hypothetical protein